jgi:molecular chaperone DnaJ
MNIKEAYNTLGLQENCSEDELKTQYKKLALQFHPDRNKENPDKLKFINEAYQYINDYREHPEKYNPSPFARSPFDGGFGFPIDLNDLIGNHNQAQKRFRYPEINIPITISFKESVIGTDKDIQFNRYVKCEACDAKGQETLSNGCTNCNGFGRIVRNNGNMMFTQSCNKCHGRNIKFKDCEKCNKNGVIESDVNLKLHIPAGTQNNNVLRLRGGGHFAGSSPFGEQYVDAFVRVSVNPEAGLYHDGSNVISNLNISLLEALTGCYKEVKTIYDNKTIFIPPNTKNKDEVNIKECGVGNGVQRVILDVDYPEKCDKLIEFLKGA